MAAWLLGSIEGQEVFKIEQDSGQKGELITIEGLGMKTDISLSYIPRLMNIWSMELVANYSNNWTYIYIYTLYNVTFYFECTSSTSCGDFQAWTCWKRYPYHLEMIVMYYMITIFSSNWDWNGSTESLLAENEFLINEWLYIFMAPLRDSREEISK